MFCKPLEFTLPVLPRGMSWHLFADTGLPAPDDIPVPGGEKILARQKQYSIREWTSMILVGK